MGLRCTLATLGVLLHVLATQGMDSCLLREVGSLPNTCLQVAHSPVPGVGMERAWAGGAGGGAPDKPHLHTGESYSGMGRAGAEGCWQLTGRVKTIKFKQHCPKTKLAMGGT